MIYCPYTDRELPESGTSREHIIPLSLGGVNGFEIAVDSTFNSEVGTELDGKLASEFLFALRRTEYDTRGHSGKEPVATVRATYGEDNRPALARFHKKKGVTLWDARDREHKEGKGQVQIRFALNIDLPVRFTAKVALAAGYFVYGDLFREHVAHGQLRDVMNTNPANLDPKTGWAGLSVRNLTVRVDRYLDEVPANRGSRILCIRTFCSSVKGSVVLLVPGKDYLVVAVGILGQYLALVNVPARTESFPNEGAFTWGHVIEVVDKKLNRFSWTDGLARTPECQRTL